MIKYKSLRKKIVKKIGTTRLAVLSFVIIIFVGSLLLTLPISNISNSGNNPTYLNHLFVATSATCVTGLVPYPLVSQYTFFGLLVILGLIQVGGLGVMTLLVFSLTVLKEKLYHKEKMMMHDTLNTSSLKDIPKYIRRILKYTFIFEGCGALLLMIRFIPMFGSLQGIWYSIFLSISAFCNAGMDCFSFTSLNPFVNDPLINIVVAMLIIMGGLGFSVWFDLSDVRKERSKAISKLNFVYWFKQLHLHTKLVLAITSFFLLLGTVIIYINEFNNPATLGMMNPIEKLLPAFFSSTTLRTAGFTTIDMINFRPATQLIMCILMVIGGSPGGTAGGIKTTTIIIIILTIIELAKDENNDVNLWHKRISFSTFMRSMIISTYYLFFMFVALFILLIFDSNATLMQLLFEICSAIGTVGLSMNLTPLLSSIGQVVIISLMLFGRVGPMSIVLSMMSTKNKKLNYHYSKGEILIG